jgi:hypothetical protein
VIEKRKNGTDAEHCVDAYADLRAVPCADIYAEHCAEFFAVMRAERKTVLMQDFKVRQKQHYRCKTTTWYTVQSVVQSSVQMLVQKKMAPMQKVVKIFGAESRAVVRAESFADARADHRAVIRAESDAEQDAETMQNFVQEGLQPQRGDLFIEDEGKAFPVAPAERPVENHGTGRSAGAKNAVQNIVQMFVQ